MSAPSKFLLVIQEVLFREWDPIGVNSCEQCRDEYNGYAPELLRLLMRGADEYKLAQRLLEFQQNSMGMSTTNVERHQRVARILMERFAEFQ